MKRITLLIVFFISILCRGQEYYSKTEKSKVVFEMFSQEQNRYGPGVLRPSYVTISYENNWLYVHDSIECADRWYRIIETFTINGRYFINSEDMNNNDELCGIELISENGNRKIEFVYSDSCKFRLSAPMDICQSEIEQY